MTILSAIWIRIENESFKKKDWVARLAMFVDKNIIKKTRADFGGIEYIINRETGKPCYFDFNPYSNFVSHGETFLGFSPEQRFVDFIKNLC